MFSFPILRVELVEVEGETHKLQINVCATGEVLQVEVKDKRKDAKKVEEAVIAMLRSAWDMADL